MKNTLSIGFLLMLMLFFSLSCEKQDDICSDGELCDTVSDDNLTAQNDYITEDVSITQKITVRLSASQAKDAWISEYYPESNYGTFPNILASDWTHQDSSAVSRSLMYFDLSEIPAEAEIDSVYMSLYYAPIADPGTHSARSGSNACWLQRIIEPWDEDSVTWVNQPATTEDNMAVITETLTNTEDKNKIDVTSMVQDMVKYSENSFGFLMRLKTEEAYRRMTFASSDYGVDTLVPKLDIYYTVQAKKIIFQPGSDLGKDAMIQEPPFAENRNFVDFPNIHASDWTHGGQSAITRSLFAFPLEQIPAGAIVAHASLSLYYAPNPDNSTHSNSSGSNAFYLQRVMEPWEQNTVTWETQPTTTEENQVLIPETSSDQEDKLNMDVTSLVSNMVQTTSDNHGFMLKLQTENHYRRVTFASSNFTDETKHPKLEVTYIP